MTEKFPPPRVTIRRYAASRVCDVVVVVRGQEMVIRCPSYSHALKWARLECKSYGIPAIRTTGSPTTTCRFFCAQIEIETDRGHQSDDLPTAASGALMVRCQETRSFARSSPRIVTPPESWPSSISSASRKTATRPKLKAGARYSSSNIEFVMKRLREPK